MFTISNQTIEEQIAIYNSNFRDIGVPYFQKLNFSKFKKYAKFENNAYMTVVAKGMPNKDDFEQKIFPLLEDNQKILITVKDENQIPADLRNDKRFTFLTKNVKDFHTLFNTYIYTHKGYIDPHPRMFHECVFYGKKIIYINDLGIKDGGYYRHKDAIQNGLKTHDFNENDEIIKLLKTFME